MDVLLGALPGQYFQQTAEIVGGYVELGGYFLYGGQSFPDEVAGDKIFLQDLLEAVQDLMIGDFAGEELAVIEPFGIVEQCIYLGNDDALAEFVDIRLVFLVDRLDDTRDGGFLFWGKEQRFIHRIVKKFVVPDRFGQGGIPEEVGMDQQHPTRLIDGFAAVVLDPEYLTRRDKEHDPFIEVIFLLPVPELAAEIAFQGDVVIVEHQIQRFFPTGMPDVFDIDHADKRMLGFGQLPELMEFGNVLYPMDLVHTMFFLRRCHGTPPFRSGRWLAANLSALPPHYQATTSSLRNFPVGPSGPMVAYFTM
jgi:hypothetical protein